MLKLETFSQGMRRVTLIQGSPPSALLFIGGGQIEN